MGTVVSIARSVKSSAVVVGCLLLLSTPAWAQEFDAWCADVIARCDVDALVDFKKRAPAAQLAHPREEHFVPVIAAAAAAIDRGGDVKFPIKGFWELAPAFTRRTVQIG